MQELNYATYETALKLKELGFNEICDSVYREEQHISEEVRRNYGDLTDDGYYELTKESGCGILDFDEVYINVPMLRFLNYNITNSRIDRFAEHFICTAPFIVDVIDWLFTEHNIVVTYVPNWVSPGDTRFHFDFKVFLNQDRELHKEWSDNVSYGSVKLALQRAVEYVINNLEKIKNGEDI